MLVGEVKEFGEVREGEGPGLREGAKLLIELLSEWLEEEEGKGRRGGRLGLEVEREPELFLFSKDSSIRLSEEVTNALILYSMAMELILEPKEGKDSSRVHPNSMRQAAASDCPFLTAYQSSFAPK